MTARARVAVVVPNLFLRVPVDAAIEAAGGSPEAFADAAGAAASGCPVAVVDLDALSDPPGGIRALVGAGTSVIATGPHVAGDVLSACRAAGAVVLPRSVFLARLPELLALALGASRTAE